MEFESDAQRICYKNVSVWLREIFGEFVFDREDAPILAIQKGSALAEIGVFPWRDDDAVVSVRSWVVTGCDIRPDLLDFLLKENNKFLFGAFGLDDVNQIFIQHSIVGSTCDKPELRASVMAVAAMADDYDDVIVSRWGGETAQDRFKEG
jgi:hypothetical protein